MYVAHSHTSEYSHLSYVGWTQSEFTPYFAGEEAGYRTVQDQAWSGQGASQRGADTQAPGRPRSDGAVLSAWLKCGFRCVAVMGAGLPAEGSEQCSHGTGLSGGGTGGQVPSATPSASGPGVWTLLCRQLGAIVCGVSTRKMDLGRMSLVAECAVVLRQGVCEGQRGFPTTFPP